MTKTVTPNNLSTQTVTLNVPSCNDEEILTKENVHSKLLRDKAALIPKNIRRQQARLAKRVAKKEFNGPKEPVAQPPKGEPYIPKAELVRREQAAAYANKHKATVAGLDHFEKLRDMRIAKAKNQERVALRKVEKRVSKLEAKFHSLQTRVDVWGKPNDEFTFWDQPPTKESSLEESDDICVHESDDDTVYVPVSNNSLEHEINDWKERLARGAMLDELTTSIRKQRAIHAVKEAVGEVIMLKSFGKFVAQTHRTIEEMFFFAHQPFVFASAFGTAYQKHAAAFTGHAIHPNVPFLHWSNILTHAGIYLSGPTNRTQQSIMLLDILQAHFGRNIDIDVTWNAAASTLIAEFYKSVFPYLDTILQAFEEWINGAGNTISGFDFLESNLWTKVSEWLVKLLSFLTSFEVKKDSVLEKIREFLLSLISCKTATDFFKSTIELGKNVYDRCMLWYTTKDWEDFFLFDKASNWFGESTELIRACKRASGMAMSVEQQTEILRQLDNSLKLGKKLMKVKGMRDKSYLSISNIVNQLDACHIEIAASRTANQPHQTPFVVQFYANSGVGKTSSMFAAGVQFMLCDGLTGPQINPGAIYNLNMRDEYDSQHKIGQVGFMADEIGSLKATFDDGCMYTRIMCIVNMMPTLANMAAVEDKGKHYLHFNWGVVSSNFKNCKAHTFLDNPYAFLRRLNILVTVAIKREFQKAGLERGYSLDKDKLGDRDVIDAQLWHIQERTVSSNNIVETLMYPEEHTIKDDIEGISQWVDGRLGLDILRRLYEKHRGQQELVVQHTNDYFSRGKCEACGLLFCRCAQIQAAQANVASFTTYLPLFCFGMIFITTFFRYVRATIQLLLDGLEENRRQLIEDLKLAPQLVADSVFTRLTPSMRELRKYVLMLLSSSMAISMLWMVFKPRKAKTNDVAFNMVLDGKDYKVEASKSVPYKYPISQQRVQPNRIIYVPDALHPCAPTTFIALSKKVRKATYMIFVSEPNKPTRTGVGCFLVGSYFVTAAHVLGSTTGMITLRNAIHTLKPFVFDENHIFHISPDVVAIFCPTTSPHADLTPYIGSWSGEQSYNGGQCSIITFRNWDNEIAKGIAIDAIVLSEHETFREVVSLEKLEDGSTKEYRGPGVQLDISPNLIAKGNSGSLVINSKCQIVGLVSNLAPDKCSVGVMFVDKVKNYAFNGVTSLFCDEEPNVVSAELTYATSPRSILPHFIDSSLPMRYFGTLTQYRYNPPKSNLRKSIAFNLARPRIIGDVPVPGICHSRVLEENGSFIYMDPMLTAACELNSPQGSEVNLGLAYLCFDDYARPIMNVPRDPEKAGGPLSLQQSLNSAIPFSRLPMNTAAGISLGRKKKDHVDQLADGTYVLKPEVQVKFDKYCQNFMDGKERPILNATIKDEARKPEKIAMAQERMFCATEFFFTLICRMYLMPVFVWMMDNNVIMEHMVGINAMSVDWKGLYDHLSVHKFHLAGDFAHFDQSHQRIFMRFFHVMCRKIASVHLDYSTFDMAMLDRIVLCCIFYVVSFKGDIVEPTQGVGSGLPITIFINCFMCSMYIRLAWYFLITQDVIEPGNFRDFNRLATFGDDHILNTACPRFGLSAIRDALINYGITYTPADKGAITSEFQQFDRITFLKRGFLQVELRGVPTVLCPLEVNSIWKSLLYVKCDIKEEKHQVAMNVVDAHKQFFFWGPKVFEEEKRFLQSLAKALQLDIGEEGVKTTLRWMSFEELTEMYFSKTLTIAFV